MAMALRNWMFTGAATNNVCPSWRNTLKCNPTSACATDNETGRQYCCEDVNQGTCWIDTTPCATDGSTFKCTRGSSSWCCLTDKEICTESAGQINICWAAEPKNLLRDISPNALRSAYSSLTSARPDASSYTFDPQLLIAATASPSSSSSRPATSDTSTTSTPSTNTQTTESSTTETAVQTGGGAGSSDNLGNSPVTGDTSTGGGDKNFGAGAIAGIIIGVVAGIALGAALTWFLLRRARRRAAAGVAGAEETSPPMYHDNKYVYSGHPQMPAEMHSPSQEHKPTVAPVAAELAANQGFYAELPSNQHHR
ncbi:hypothetical protein QBC35DRAFT_131794 [Podospora australis]|uniref:Mid2 domain-containing protein n=1 Tax=Podospora australis TaxID=1536484 RepID=A0AAN7ABZ6_9PEZI|nr:hypothetical protein QBC35DRAFT_131794 [Podospora australis]